VVKAVWAPTGLEGKALPAPEMGLSRPGGLVGAQRSSMVGGLVGALDGAADFSPANVPRPMVPLEKHRAPLQVAPTWLGTGMGEGMSSSRGADKALSLGGGALMATVAAPALAWGGASSARCLSTIGLRSSCPQRLFVRTTTPMTTVLGPL